MDDEKEVNYLFLYIFMKNKLLIGGFDLLDCLLLLQYIEEYFLSILRMGWYEYLWQIYKNKLISINNIRLVKVYICLIIVRKNMILV